TSTAAANPHVGVPTSDHNPGSTYSGAVTSGVPNAAIASTAAAVRGMSIRRPTVVTPSGIPFPSSPETSSAAASSASSRSTTPATTEQHAVTTAPTIASHAHTAPGPELNGPKPRESSPSTGLLYCVGENVVDVYPVVSAVSSTAVAASGTPTHATDNTGRTAVATRVTNIARPSSPITPPAASRSHRAGLSGASAEPMAVNCGRTAPKTAEAPVTDANTPVASSSLRPPGNRVPFGLVEDTVTSVACRVATNSNPNTAATTRQGPTAMSSDVMLNAAARGGTPHAARASARPSNPPPATVTSRGTTTSNTAPADNVAADNTRPTSSTAGPSKAFRA